MGNIKSIKANLEQYRQYANRCASGEDVSYYFFNELNTLCRDLIAEPELFLKKELEELVDIWFEVLNIRTSREIVEYAQISGISTSAYHLYCAVKKNDEIEAESFLDIFLSSNIEVFNLMSMETREEDDLSIRLSFAQANAFTWDHYHGVFKDARFIEAIFGHSTIGDNIYVAKLGIKEKALTPQQFFLMYYPRTNVDLYCSICDSKDEAAHYILRNVHKNFTQEIITAFDKFKLHDLDSAKEIFKYINEETAIAQKQAALGYSNNSGWKKQEMERLGAYAQVIYDKANLSKNIAIPTVVAGPILKI